MLVSLMTDKIGKRFEHIEKLKLKVMYLCRWVQITNDKSAERYRERRNDSDDDEEEDVKPIVKTERLSPCEQQDANISNENCLRALSGLHLTFNLEAGSLLPLAIKLVMTEQSSRFDSNIR